MKAEIALILPKRERFAQFTWRRVTVGGHLFKRGSSDQIFVGLIGVTF